jgi:type II secretory ATPase GspE/PulE/Tfp pilus assembly ATPase PilB-like protein
LLDEILNSGITSSASDIHVEPYVTSVRVRFRVDGVLFDRGCIPTNRKLELVARIKVLAGLDVAEKRRPQDGRFDVSADGRSVDIRVSVMPTRHGEKVVLRLLDKGQMDITLDSLRGVSARPVS